MKLIHAVAFTGLCLITGANAFAQATQSTLTRAEVRAQLIQAEKDGIVPVDKHDYPPGPETIARNKALYALRHEHSSNNAVASAPQDATDSSAMTN
ncbi:DUF4148 domain-containing protein [Paraburkholderia sp. SIMBA_049]